MQLIKIKNLLLILISFSIIACNQETKSSASSDSLAYLNGGEGEWVLKIDDLTVNQTNFYQDMKASLLFQNATEDQIPQYINDSSFKQYYSEVLIRDALLLKKANEEHFFDSNENKIVMDAAIRTVKAQYYLGRLVSEAMKTIPDPTPEQIQAFFEQAKPQLAQYGITVYNTETIPYIAQFYKSNYAQQLVERDLQDLKDKAVIEKNKAVLGESSMLPPQVGDSNAAINAPANDLLPRTN